MTKVEIEGTICNADGTVNTEFNGNITASLFDGETFYRNITYNDESADESLKVQSLTNATGQQWTVVNSTFDSGYPYLFKSVLSGLAIDMANNNTSLSPLQWTDEVSYNNSQNENQEFYLVGQGNNTYKLRTKYTDGGSTTIYYLTTTTGETMTRTTDESAAAVFGFILVDGSEHSSCALVCGVARHAGA